MKKIHLLCAFILSAVAFNVWAQSSAPSSGNPIAGVWRLNLERSTFNPGPPPSQPSTHMYMDRGDDGIIAVTHGVNNEGIPEFSISSSRYDGREVPLYNIPRLAGWLETSTLAPAQQVYKVVNPNTIEITIREGNQTIYSSIRTVSPDRTQMYYDTIENLPDGSTERNQLYFDAVCGDTEYHTC